MESFSELIKKRRSTRKFTEEELTQDEVVLLLKAALMSPSSISANSPPAAASGGAPLAVVVLADPLASDVWIEDASIASLMIQLEAEDLGLGSCWVQVRERSTAEGVPADEVVRELLDIPLQMQVLSIIAVGHKAVERKPFDEDNLQWEKVHINKYGAQ